ncbi:uncharacterized protein [Halyomorpha halys]|uniref:uncharacterized protein n=1 Tax=Halyomorpha halys TaxID=286706 RepID=UPI0006D50287|nr:uncharacterized protein LOC106688035 [Halyomorpha halys]
MSEPATKLISNIMLLFSSCLGLKTTPRSLKYARSAFKLYTLSGTFGTLSALFSSPMIQDFDETIWVWCYCLCIPLLACDLCVLSQYTPDTGPLHLGIPVYMLLSYHFFPDYVDPILLSISHSMSILFLSVCSACEGHLCGYALAFLHFFTMWRMGYDEKSHIDWATHMTMSNFLALNVIEWIMEEKGE